ncbi:Olfactory receptor, insect [Cinara cedri]|uniref:Odorant receptor n=1 Tax=Cinara cedri TaxID=506608 RepID=A0A5E4M373_9HEMI|nr:Olfactory receptor, insect [Cinara cedri]
MTGGLRKRNGVSQWTPQRQTHESILRKLHLDPTTGVARADDSDDGRWSRDRNRQEANQASDLIDDENDHTVMDVKLFKTIGLYHLLQPTGKIYRTRVKVIVKVMIALHLTQIFGLYYAINDLKRFANMTVLSISGLSCLFKGYVLVTNGSKLRSMLEVAGYEFMESSHRDPSKLHQCKGRLCVLLRMFTVCSYSTLVIWIVGPFFVGGYELITNLDGNVSEYRTTINNQWVPVSESMYNLTPVWAFFYAIEALMLIVNVFCWTNFDCFLVTMCFVLNAQFHILSAGYESIGHRGHRSQSSSPRSTDNSIMGSDAKKDSYDELIRFLKDSQKLMQTYKAEPKEGCVALDEANDLEVPPNSNIDVVFERNGGKLDDFMITVRPVVLVQIANGSCSVIILLFLTSLKDTLNFGLYCSNWTEMDKQFKKTLLVAMNLNSAHKRQMKTSPESVINLEMFSKVMNLSYSIVSVLLNSSQEKN